VPSKRNGKNVTGVEQYDNAVGAARSTPYELGFADGVKTEKKHMVDAISGVKMAEKVRVKLMDVILDWDGR
jgi:hypothetical protein